MSKENKQDLKAKVAKQLQDYVDEVLRDGGAVDRLLNSGALDLSEPEEGFTTSSRIVCALGRRMEDQYTPLGDLKAHKREVKNIESFI
ncbi:hypothetical protein VCHA53O466_140159 [Vibrio chagasii]|nr:hypothetical protein VCHA53O466_140159 [Vibrio chagasii]